MELLREYSRAVDWSALVLLGVCIAALWIAVLVIWMLVDWWVTLVRASFDYGLWMASMALKIGLLVACLAAAAFYVMPAEMSRSAMAEGGRVAQGMMKQVLGMVLKLIHGWVVD